VTEHTHTHTHADGSVHEGTHEACALAHGDVPADVGTRTLVAVFANPVSSYLMHFARDAGFHTILVEPDQANVTDEVIANADGVASTVDPSFADSHADIVFCDHHRPELGDVMTAALAYPARWIGVMGNARDVGPHVDMLRDRGVPEDLIATVHRPIGLNIGSKTPAEIAISTLAGLIADRNSRPGGFAFPKPPATGR
jgi:xanthine dehydrogenase accessory factor